jgi:PAS domain-containing protein
MRLSAFRDRSRKRDQKTMKSILTDYEEHSTTYRADRHDQTPAHQLPNSLMFLLQTRTAEAIFVVDPDYRIVYWEARAESLTGLLSEETIGKPCQEVLGGECEAGRSGIQDRGFRRSGGRYSSWCGSC